MQPVLVMPMNDPAGTMFPRLKAITPTLKALFAQAFVSVSPATQLAQQDSVAWLQADEYFRVLLHQQELPVGDDFLTLYRMAASACPPEQVAHLCWVDRVAFALQSEFREPFMRDVRAVTQAQTPLIFQRSEVAWQTHPGNYREIEQFVTYIGELMLGKTLDFAWCHLAASVGQLQAILPRVHNHDFSILAEIVLLLRDKIQTREVDWLAWEDPFILGRDAAQLKAEREDSQQETRKRLSYALPTLDLLYAVGSAQR